MRWFVAVLLLLLAPACAARHPQLTREQWLGLTSRDYPGVSEEQVFAAAERIFRHADGDDFQITYAAHEMAATHPWLIYLVVSFTAGTDFWTIRTEPAPEGTRVHVRIGTQTGSVMANPAAGAGATTTTPTATGQVGSPAIYELFWARMDYMLGRSTKWTTCKDMRDLIHNKVTWGETDQLCSGLTMLGDLGPPPAPL